MKLLEKLKRHEIEQLIDEILATPNLRPDSQETNALKLFLIDIALNKMHPGKMRSVSIYYRKVYQAGIYHVIEPLYPTFSRESPNTGEVVFEGLYKLDYAHRVKITKIIQFGNRDLNIDVLKCLYNETSDVDYFQVEPLEEWQKKILKEIMYEPNKKTIYNWRDKFVEYLKNKVVSIVLSDHDVQKSEQELIELDTVIDDAARKLQISSALTSIIFLFSMVSMSVSIELTIFLLVITFIGLMFVGYTVFRLFVTSKERYKISKTLKMDTNMMGVKNV